MSKARTLANLISDNAELADGQISVAEVVGAAPTASPTFTGNIDAGDNVKIRLGDSDDLQIYHDGTHSYVDDQGTGQLRLRGTTQIQFLSGANDYMATMANDGAVTLYHNNAAKLATTSTGIQVTGNIANATGDLTLDVAGDIILDSGGFDVKLKVDGTEYAKFSNYQNNFYLEPIAQDKDLIIRGNDGGSVITALTLDMSEAGAATFNGAVNIPGFIKHVGDDNTFFGFPSGDEFRIETGGAERISINGSATTFNEDGADKDFRVESDSNTNMLFVDGGEDIVSMGMPAGVPSWIGGNSVVVADNLYAFQGASYSNACFNLSVDNNFTYLLHNAYYGSGWKQRLTGYAPTMLQTGSAAYNFNYAADTGSDASISWISLMALNSSGAIFNEAGNAGQDFRVESNNNSNCFVIDANSDEIYLGKGSGAGASIGGIIHAKSNRFYQFLTETTTNAGDAIMYLNRQSSDGKAIYFRRANSNVGNISLTSSGTTYNTTSDRRLKDNIEPIADATDKLMSMKPVTHTWIANPEAPSVHGFIAQEMQEIVPEAVSGEDGGEEMMSMDYGRITPVLVAALQEATNEINALKQRVSELEAI